MLLLKMALRNLVRSPIRRTLAVVLTVAMGTGSLFIFHGFNQGVMNQYRENTIRSRFGFGQVHTKGYRDIVYEKPWENWIENPLTVESEIKKIPGVKQVFPRLEFGGMLTNGSINVSARGQGVVGSEESTFFNTLNIEEGQTLSTQVNGILLGRGLARALRVKPGDRVTVLANTLEGSFNGVDLEVSGIFHTGQKDFDDVVFRMQLSEAQKLLVTDKVESMALNLDETLSWEGFLKSFKEKFPNLDATSFAVLDKVYYQNAVDWLDAQFGVIQLIILSVVILGIFSTVSTSVFERKQEIGNLRANGDSKIEIISLISAENAALGMAGALLGILLVLLFLSTFLSKGILMPPSPGITRQFYVLIEVSPLMAFKVFFMGIFACTLGAVLASLRVTRLPISEALRSV